MIELNKKILGICIVLIFAAMLATPIVGTASAGKGQEKLDFELYMDNVQPVGVDDVKVTDGITHYEGYHAMPAGEYYVKVDGVTYYPTDYFFSADFASTSRMALHIKESIIFADGTIEIQIQDHLREPFMGTFNGFGTGSLEGVKVQGTTVGTGPGGYFLRTGTVMGWPTT